METAVAVRVTCSDSCHSSWQTHMLSPAPVICPHTNPAFRLATNLLSTALLTRVLFDPLFLVSKVSAERGRAGVRQKGKRITSHCQDMISRHLINQKYSNLSQNARLSVSLKELIKGRGQKRGPAEAFKLRSVSPSLSLRGIRPACITDSLQSLWSSIKCGLVAWRS